MGLGGEARGHFLDQALTDMSEMAFSLIDIGYPKGTPKSIG